MADDVKFFKTDFPDDIQGIYCITNTVNGKRYIGQSNNIRRRLIDHLSCSSNSNKKLSNDIKLYGISNFLVEILESTDGIDKELLCELEYRYKKLYEFDMLYNGRRGNEYNQDVANRHPVIAYNLKTKELEYYSSKLAASEILKCNRRNILSCINDKVYSVSNRIFFNKDDYSEELLQYRLDKYNTVIYELRQKQSITSKSHERTNKKRVRQVDKNTGEVIKEYDSILSASKSVGTTAANIRFCANKKTKTAKGYKWEFIND